MICKELIWQGVARLETAAIEFETFAYVGNALVRYYGFNVKARARHGLLASRCLATTSTEYFHFSFRDKLRHSPLRLPAEIKFLASACFTAEQCDTLENHLFKILKAPEIIQATKLAETPRYTRIFFPLIKGSSSADKYAG